ncbi:protein COFACTOR ASSEMBLY OF COMPLEX C SUBUNIT B CCB2, chloroplastic isoform X3 [Cryptomeria japonica]|uniref:protein COFACTOR ASSEMBLY OF COMPLEX C SUBUNIT B CCB2, chloroplastic isoform X3 n=1 Tax=Cryptomeria japonica TaxID=3369 RepID=UPI0027DA9ABD|nr:protein COFACTOR ASSEMBLY OF COMPLEX C SUBUNIT B CCB2, chloroplastic isoform X3 [Cryptomeria japonica]
MESSRVGMGMGMRMVIGMGMVIPVASGPYARRFSFLTTFTRSCLSKRSFLLRPKLKPSPSIIIPHARSKNSIDVDDLSVFRFTLGIVGFDESYLPRIIGILFGFLLVLNHVSTQTSVTAAQLRSEFVGIFLVAISISIPYVGKRLKLIYHSEPLCARGCWDMPAEASKDDIFTMLEHEIDQLGLSHVTETLYFPNYVDRQGLGRVTKGAASLLVQPFNWRVSSNDNTVHSGGFILLFSSVPQAYGDKDRAWVAALANKLKNIECMMEK